MQKKILCMVTVISMIMSLFSSYTTAANSSFNTAKSIEISQNISGNLTKDEKNIYYAFDLSKSGRVICELEIGTLECYTYELYDSDGDRLYREGYLKNNGKFVWDLSAEKHYLKINSESGKLGTFNFTLNFTDAGVNHNEDNAVKNTSACIEIGEQINSMLTANKKEEYFAFELEEAGRVTFDLSINTLECYTYELYDNYGDRLYREGYLKNDGKFVWDLMAGRHYLKINSESGKLGTFSFNSEFESAGINHNTGNESITTAEKIQLNKKIKSIFIPNKRTEYFSFSINDSQELNFEVILDNLECYTYELCDNYGKRLYREGYLKNDGSFDWNLSGGTYYLKINAESGTGSFSFIISQRNDDEDDYQPEATKMPVSTLQPTATPKPTVTPTAEPTVTPTVKPTEVPERIWDTTDELDKITSPYYNDKNSEHKGTITVDSRYLTISIDGEDLEWYDAYPFVDSNGRTQVPIRFISEYLGYNVTWTGYSQKVEIEGNGKTIILNIGSSRLNIDGELTYMDTSALIRNDRTYIPVRYVAEALGYEVVWD